MQPERFHSCRFVCHVVACEIPIFPLFRGGGLFAALAPEEAIVCGVVGFAIGQFLVFVISVVCVLIITFIGVFRIRVFWPLLLFLLIL